MNQKMLALQKQIERDPSGKAACEAGSKLDAEKPDASLLLDFGRALLAVAEVSTFGAKKYTRGGWLSVPDGENRYTAALVRHLFNAGVDADSGLSHDAHLAWNALARLELRLRKGIDNA